MRPVCVIALTYCFACSSLLAQDRLAPVPAPLRAQSSMAKRAFESGDYVEAEKIYRELQEKAPDNVYLLTNLGIVYFRQLKYHLAKKMFERAIEIAPNDGFSHCTLGIVLYSEGKYEEATEELGRALKIDENNVTAHNYLGITLSQMGKVEEARKELDAAVTLDPRYADAAFNFAVALATVKPVNIDKARYYYRKALDLGAERDMEMEKIVGGEGRQPGANVAEAAELPKASPPPGPARMEAKEQFERGNYAEAEKLYRDLLKTEPRNLYLLSNLGVVLFRANKWDEAEKMFKQAIAVEPGDGFSHATLGIVYYSQGKLDDAVNELTKALAIDPRNATAHNYLGIVAAQKGWKEAAAKELETARKLDPKYKENAARLPEGDLLTPVEKSRKVVPAGPQ